MSEATGSRILPTQALILAGGSGTRFWPLSRRRRPKQLLRLEGEETLLQATVGRLEPLVPRHAVWVCTTESLLPEVRRQLPAVPRRQILAEPVGRNTAAAIGWAVRSMPKRLRDAPVIVLPADHRVGDARALRRRLKQAAAAVRGGEPVVTLGVVPRWAETGYGYLHLGVTLDASTGLRRVRRFVEKPDMRTARRYVDSGAYLWNAGIFVFRGETLLRCLREHQPEIALGLERIAARPARRRAIYARLPAISIDHGVMEHLRRIATLALDCGWSDLGSWQALMEVHGKDGQGNSVAGDVLALDAANNLLYAEQGTVAALGVEGLAVVRTGDAVLVLPLARSQEVRRILAELEARSRRELL